MSDFGDFSRYSRIIPEEHLPALRSSLKRIPDFSWLLAAPHPTERRLQGDILKECPTVVIDDLGEPRATKFPVMILNNSCDLPDDRMDFVTIAPVVDFGKYLEFEKSRRSPNSLDGFAKAIRQNDKTELFYLPKFAGFQNGALVLLHLVCSVSAKVYRSLLSSGKREASFTQIGFYFLLIKLTTHLARAESAEVERASGYPG
jgi:hypothetical protein